MTEIPSIRVSCAVDRPIRTDGEFVLYWMIAERRSRWSFALQHAVAHAARLGRPLLVLEPLDVDYRWACDRFHAFILQGMRDNRNAFANTPVRHLAWVGASSGAGRGLLAALAERACLVITDERPAYRYPALVARAASRLTCRVEQVDGCGVLPLRQAPKAYKRAVDFRRYVHKAFAQDPPELPVDDPVAGADLVPFEVDLTEITERWPEARLDALLGPGGLDDLPIDHDIAPVRDKPGGPDAGAARLERFLLDRLDHYTERNHPDEEVASGLSPWLHFGHVGGAQVVAAILDEETFDPERMNADRFSKQEGAWGLSAGAESFLEEVITWRELSFQTAFLEPEDHARFEGLPAWAQKSLIEHAADPREHLYSLEELAAGQTSDPLWNAAQRQLREEGIIHNYLRMLWGKRVLAWTESPQQCFEWLVELNNRYALDGRDPNSYGGIAWVLGRYDRAWGPERPIYGKIRYMTSASTRRKLRLKGWLSRWETP